MVDLLMCLFDVFVGGLHGGFVGVFVCWLVDCLT